MEPPKPESEPDCQSNPNKSDPKGVAVAGGVAKGPASESQVPTVSTASSLPSPPSSASNKKSVRWSPELVTETTFVSSPHEYSHSYSSFSSSSFSQSSSSFSVIETAMAVRNVLGRWKSKVGEATRKAEALAGNTWQHLKTSPSITEAAMGRIAQGTKVLAEGGHENIFLRTFETVPEERLQNFYACYLSTSAGPIMGVLYISTAKVAYCSDNPISYRSDDDNRTKWSHYKVVIPLHELKEVIPSSSTVNPAEKYLQVNSVNNHEFWFMGFLNYDSAVDSLQIALQAGKLQV